MRNKIFICNKKKTTKVTNRFWLLIEGEMNKTWQTRWSIEQRRSSSVLFLSLILRWKREEIWAKGETKWSKLSIYERKKQFRILKWNLDWKRTHRQVDLNTFDYLLHRLLIFLFISSLTLFFSLPLIAKSLFFLFLKQRTLSSLEELETKKRETTKIF